MSYLPNAQKVTGTSIPTAGATIAIPIGTEVYVAVPAGTLATLTVSFPAAPVDGTLIKFISTQAVTSLTVSSQGSDSFVGAPSALSANVPFELIYLKSNTTWYKSQ
jgi:hypothetical protein